MHVRRQAAGHSGADEGGGTVGSLAFSETKVVISRDTARQMKLQLQAQASVILAEGLVLDSFQHRGTKGIEREVPLRRFFRSHLPKRFLLGQGSIASAVTLLERQHDIIIADADTCFLLLATESSQLYPIEAVQVIVEIRSGTSHLDSVGASLHDVRCLEPAVGLRQLGPPLGSIEGKSPPPVQTVVIYSAAKEPKTIVDKVASTNALYANGAHKRMVFDYVLVMAKDGESSPSSGYLVGYSRTEQTATGDARTYAHHYYPQYGEPGLEGPKVLHTGCNSESFEWRDDLSSESTSVPRSRVRVCALDKIPVLNGTCGTREVQHEQSSSQCGQPRRHGQAVCIRLEAGRGWRPGGPTTRHLFQARSVLGNPISQRLEMPAAFLYLRCLR